MDAGGQLDVIFHWMVDRVPPQTIEKLKEMFQSAESVHPIKIFYLLLEQMPVWTDDVTSSYSWTEASHKDAVVMKRIEKLKRRANYLVELPQEMEKSVAPDEQLTTPPYQYSPGVGSMSYSPYTSPLEKDTTEPVSYTHLTLPTIAGV